MSAENLELPPKPNRLVGDLRELISVVAIVLVVIAGLTALATQRAGSLMQQPVSPNAKGIVKLVPYDAEITGSVTLYPTALETQTKDFSYTHGRKVLEERRERKAGDWTDPNTTLTWNFTIPEATPYEVRVSYACTDEAADSEALLVIDNVHYEKAVRSTGGWDTWKRLKFGRIQFQPGTHQLVLKAKNLVNERFLNFSDVTLTPVKE